MAFPQVRAPIPTIANFSKPRWSNSPGISRAATTASCVDAGERWLCVAHAWQGLRRRLAIVTLKADGTRPDLQDELHISARVLSGTVAPAWALLEETANSTFSGWTV